MKEKFPCLGTLQLETREALAAERLSTGIFVNNGTPLIDDRRLKENDIGSKTVEPGEISRAS